MYCTCNTTNYYFVLVQATLHPIMNINEPVEFRKSNEPCFQGNWHLLCNQGISFRATLFVC